MKNSNERYNLSYSILEDSNGKEFHVHCEVYVWKLSVMKELYKDFAKLLEEAKSSGFDTVWSVSPNPKFCLMYGAEDLGVDYHGYRIMFWRI